MVVIPGLSGYIRADWPGMFGGVTDGLSVSMLMMSPECIGVHHVRDDDEDDDD